MKLRLFLLTNLVCLSFAIAQDYNRWSIEFGGGMHKPTRNFSTGFYTEHPAFGFGEVGVRYMFNEKFGLKADFGYHQIEDSGDSQPFETTYIRTSLQGVANLGNIFNFRSWTQRINLLAHAGLGYSVNSPDKPIDRGNDEMLNFMAGLTPQFKLSNRLALYGDLSVIGHARAQLPWDGATNISPTSRSGLDGVLINYSIGLNISLGKADTHADWYSEESDLQQQLQEAQQRVEKLESDLIDSDMDGVPDYLDREPNTTSGVAVDSKGVAIDRNNNGIPDELEGSLDNRYASKDKVESISSSSSASGVSTVKDLLNKGYLNVYFRFNSDRPELSSMETVNIIKQYMKENPSASAELIGYADELGDASYNKQLSERRAKFIYDVLIASGIDASRLSYSGGGVDASVDKSSPYARQLVRRVTFRIK